MLFVIFLIFGLKLLHVQYTWRNVSSVFSSAMTIFKTGFDPDALL